MFLKWFLETFFNHSSLCMKNFYHFHGRCFFINILVSQIVFLKDSLIWGKKKKGKIISSSVSRGLSLGHSHHSGLSPGIMVKSNLHLCYSQKVTPLKHFLIYNFKQSMTFLLNLLSPVKYFFCLFSFPFFFFFYFFVFSSPNSLIFHSFLSFLSHWTESLLFVWYVNMVTTPYLHQNAVRDCSDQYKEY